LLRNQLFAIHRRRGLHHGTRRQAIKLRAALLIGCGGPTRSTDEQRHLLAGDVVAHSLAHHAHTDRGVWQFGCRQWLTRDRAGIGHGHLRARCARAQKQIENEK
jgi:hypothetical protein